MVKRQYGLLRQPNTQLLGQFSLIVFQELLVQIGLLKTTKLQVILENQLDPSIWECQMIDTYRKKL